MEAAQVVVVAEFPVAVPGLPVALGVDAVQQRPVVQDRQVEPLAVPRHQIRRIAGQAVEEPLHDLLFRGALVAEGKYVEIVAGAQDGRDGDHPVLIDRQEFRAAGLALLEEHDLAHVFIAQVIDAVKAAAEIRVRNRFDVEDQGIQCESFDFISTATATTRPASSVNVRWPSPIPSLSRMASPLGE